MRIAYFVWEYPPRIVGGLGTYASDLVERLEKFGNEVSVFTLNTENLKTDEQIGKVDIHRPKTMNASGVMKLLLRYELRGWGDHLSFFDQIFSYNYLSAMKFLNDLSLKKKYDLVVVHDWLSAIAGLIIKQNTDLPVVFHVHSTEQQRVGEGSQTIKTLEMEMAEKADAIITVSYSMRDHLVNLGYPRDKINVVWNGCDTDKYKMDKVNWEMAEELRKKYNIKKEQKVVFFVGRFTWVKGVENLVLGFPSVLKDYPNTKLIVLGKGEAYNDLVEIVNRFDMKDNVVIRSDFVSEEERIAHYGLSDICVFPSFAEPFGIVSLEAMCLKKPVVVGASGISGFREQIIPKGEEQTGIHIDGKTPEDVAWGIKEVLKDDKKAKLMGENGRKRAEEIFNLDKVGNYTLQIYKKTVKEKKSK